MSRASRRLRASRQTRHGQEAQQAQRRTHVAHDVTLAVERERASQHEQPQCADSDEVTWRRERAQLHAIHVLLQREVSA